MSSPFAALPTELILSITSLAAVHQPTALVLSLVSSWVRTHVEPALYHTVRLRSARSLASFISTLNSKPPGFAHRTIKKLCITALGPISSIRTVLSKCTGVTSLASSFSVPSYIHCDQLPPTIRERQGTASNRLPIAPREQHLLALACRDGLDMAMLSPAVSRLRIQLTPAVTSESMTRLAELDHLTHLALVYHQRLFGGSRGVDSNAIEAMLGPVLEGGRLSVLVLQVAGGAEDAYLEDVWRWGEAWGSSKHVWHDGLERSDVRLVVSASRAPRSFLSEWEESDAFWERASEGGMVA